MTAERNVSRVVVEAGLVPEDMLEQMRRWGMPVEATGIARMSSAREIVESIQEALESEDMVEMRDTDLDMLRRYLTHQQRGKLHVSDGETKSNFTVSFCFSELGEVVIPWRSESLHDLMLNEETYLQYSDDTGKHKVHFSGVRELYLGSRKAFMVCATTERVRG